MSNSHSESTVKVVLSAVLGNGLITLAKFIGWFLTASPSLLAEAIHSGADTANQVLLFIGIKHGEGKVSTKYPFGQGSARYLWNLISAVGIFFLGFGVTAYHGIHSLLTLDQNPYTPIHPVAIYILLFAMCIEGYVFLMALKEVKSKKGKDSYYQYLQHSDDPTSLAVLLEDGIAVLGVIFALVGIYISEVYQSAIPDSIAAIVIAFLLGFMAIALAYINSRLLIGRSISVSDERRIRRFLMRQAEVERVAQLKTLIVGAGKIRLTCELEFHGGFFIDREQIKQDADRIKA
ncbi:MAG: cation diffusion facilitator family transporter, partial [Bdellovibrionales bacterium]|nr:cation diffusion facilitator family transporter [Bdellovibrionales bacterium]